MGEYIDYYVIELNCIFIYLDKFQWILNTIYASDKKLLRHEI